MAETKEHQYKVSMTCDSCSKAVERVLGKLKGHGVDDFTVNLDDQKVTVKTTKTSDEILEALKKTGRDVQYVSSS